jgi:hypothetical protein
MRVDTNGTDAIAGNARAVPNDGFVPELESPLFIHSTAWPAKKHSSVAPTPSNSNTSLIKTHFEGHFGADDFVWSVIRSVVARRVPHQRRPPRKATPTCARLGSRFG